MAQRTRGVRNSILTLSLLLLTACGGGSGGSSGSPQSSNPPSGGTPATIEGVATPSSVSVVTATNAS